MAHNVTSCVTVVCDRCHVPALNPAGTPQHWPTFEQALAELSGPPWSWAASSSAQTCAACLQVLDCLEHGHDWGGWRPMEHLGEPDLAIRLCGRCGRDEITPAGLPRPGPRRRPPEGLMTRWMHVNTAAGYVVFGVPTLLAIPAVAATIARFGIWHTLTSAVLPVAMVIAPLLLWTRYTRHRPAKTVARLTWSGVAVLAFLLLASSPLWFWTGPVLLVLLSELARVLLATIRDDDADPRTGATTVRAQP